MPESALSRNAVADADGHELAGLLRTVDALSPRPAGAPITLASLRRRAHRQRLRATLTLLAVAGLGLAASLLIGRPTPTSTSLADAGVQRLIQTLRRERANESVRDLLRRQAAELARARCAAVSAVYAEHVAAVEPAHGSTPRGVTLSSTGTDGKAATAARLAAPTENPR